MVRITVDLLRKRAEHNEGCLSTLEEIALHQQDIEKLEVIGDMCRQLQILYLCNNYIGKIENINMLKRLTYLNLAVNNVKVIEGLEGCESLEKLDLTLNFVADVSCVANLRGNIFLETLHLTGNPCTNVDGYRKFVIQTLPQLQTLDGEDVNRSELIVARQDKDGVAVVVDTEREKVLHEQRLHQEMRAKGIDPFPPKYNEEGERVYGHSAEERIQMLRETEKEEEAKKNPPKDPNSISAIHEEINKKAVRLTPQQEMEKYGRIMMRNEGKIPFKMEEEDECWVVHVEPGKYISTSLINIDADVNYLRVIVKDKMLQLPAPEELHVSAISVQRSTTTGSLKLTLPYAPHVLQQKRELKKRRTFKWDDDEDENTTSEWAGNVASSKSKEDAPPPVNEKQATSATSSTAAAGLSSAKKSDDAVKTRVTKDIGLAEATKKATNSEPSAPSTATPSNTAAAPQFQPSVDSRGKRVESYVEELE